MGRRLVASLAAAPSRPLLRPSPLAERTARLQPACRPARKGRWAAADLHAYDKGSPPRPQAAVCSRRKDDDHSGASTGGRVRGQQEPPSALFVVVVGTERRSSRACVVECGKPAKGQSSALVPSSSFFRRCSRVWTSVARTAAATKYLLAKGGRCVVAHPPPPAAPPAGRPARRPAVRTRHRAAANIPDRAPYTRRIIIAADGRFVWLLIGGGGACSGVCPAAARARVVRAHSL